MVENTEPGTEREELEKKLNDMKTRWNNTKQQAADHHALVDVTLPESEKCHDAVEELVPWLSETEQKVEAMPPLVADKTLIENRLEDLTFVISQI